MIPSRSYDGILHDLGRRGTPPIRMCGLLFAPPESPVGRDISVRLNDWHHRSGKNIDFFCVGYVEERFDEEDCPVANLTNINGMGRKELFFNASIFDEIRKRVELESDWQYSGEGDLLLVNAIEDEEFPQERKLEFSQMLALDISKIVEDGAYRSTARLMETICRAAEEANTFGCDLNVLDFSDRNAFKAVMHGALSMVVEKLNIGQILSARHFIVGGHYLKDNLP